MFYAKLLFSSEQSANSGEDNSAASDLHRHPFHRSYRSSGKFGGQPPLEKRLNLYLSNVQYRDLTRRKSPDGKRGERTHDKSQATGRQCGIPKGERRKGRRSSLPTHCLPCHAYTMHLSRRRFQLDRDNTSALPPLERKQSWTWMHVSTYR